MKGVFWFELSRQMRKPFPYIMWVLLFVQAFYYVFHAGEFFVTDGAPYNSPVMLYTLLAGIGYVSYVVYAILGAQVLNKDLEHKFAAIVYTSSVSESGYFWGNFLAALATLFIIMSGHLLGTLGFQYMGLVPQDRLMNLPAVVIWEGVMYMFLPNVIAMFIFSFAMATITKKNVGAYLSMIIAMMLMILGDTNAHEVPLLTLLDIAGFSELHRQIDYMNTEAKMNYRIPAGSLLFWNRIVWLTISITLLIISRKLFTFKKYGNSTAKSRKATLTDQLPSAAISTYTAPLVTTSFHWQDLPGMAKTHFINEVKSLRFLLFSIMVMLFYTLYVLIYQQEYYSAAPSLPTTVYILNTISPLTVFVFLYFLVVTTELIFKDRTQQFWQVADALPVSTTRYISAKVLAMAGVALVTVSLFMVIGVTIQALKGFYHFEPVVYIRNLFGYRFPIICLYILMPVFFSMLTNNRYLTHVLNFVFTFTVFVFHELEIFEQQRFLFGFTPLGSSTTAMNGLGIFNQATTWFALYWVFFSLSLIFLVFPLYQRGTLVSIKENTARYFKQWNGKFIMGLLSCLLVFTCSAWVIYDNVNVQNDFKNDDAENREAYDYERAYQQYKYIAQPKIIKFEADIELYAAARNLNYEALITLQNKTDYPIDTLHIEWMDFSSISLLEASGHQLNLLKEDDELRHNIYHIKPALLPGDSLLLNYKASLQYTGFTNHDPQPALAYNGSFIPKDIIPYFGYNSSRELKENRHRDELGLQKISGRLDPVGDTRADQSSYSAIDADEISYRITIGTTQNETAVSAGKALKEDRGERIYYTYTDEKAFHDFYILVARYAVFTQPLNVQGQQISLEIYYHPADYRNLSYIASITESALKYLQSQLGQYPYDVLRIVERPSYDEEVISFGNVIVLPDNHVWNADAGKLDDMDYAAFVLTKQIAVQYWKRGHFSAAQGYPFFINSLPDYYALSYLGTHTIPENLEKHLEKRKQNYFKKRAQEANAEPAVLNADIDAAYVADEKGGFVLYKLAEAWQTETLNNFLASHYQQVITAPQTTNSLDFKKELLLTLPDSLHSKFEEWFSQTVEVFK